MSPLAAVLAAIGGWFALAGPARRGIDRRSAQHVRRAIWPFVLPGCVLAWWLLGGRHLVLVVIATAVVALGWQRVASSRAAAAAGRRADQVVMACDSIASDLSAGQTPRRALARAAEDWPELDPVSVAAGLDADVPRVLRELADRPGAEELCSVAAAWQVAYRSGAGLAQALRGTTQRLREDRDTRRLVAAELASARATARMMAALPALVLLLGVGIGGNGFTFLTGSTVGIGCLACGLGLSWAGLVWTDRIATAVTRD